MISSSAASMFEHQAQVHSSLCLLHPGIQVYAGMGNSECRFRNEVCVYVTDSVKERASTNQREPESQDHDLLTQPDFGLAA